MTLPFALLHDAADLATFRGWSEAEYTDFLRVQRDEMSEEQFHDKNRRERAYAAVCDRDDVHFEAQDQDDQTFPFNRATRL